MTVTFEPNTYKTSLDYIAVGYWQDFLAHQPIAGGIAYASALYECQLDESLISLQRVDTLLSKIRRDLTKTNELKEDVILADSRYRNLLLFLAFYAGRVLAAQAQTSVHWLDVSEFTAHAPHLTVQQDDFYQRMAASYDKSSNSTNLFFALEPIGMRLFGHIDRPFVAVDGGQVPSGLYQAVNNQLQDLDTAADIHKNALISENKAPIPAIKAQDINNLTVATDNDNKKAIIENNVKTEEPLTQKESIADVIKPKNDEGNTHQQPNNTVNPKAKKVTITSEIFTKLLSELDTIEVTQSAGQAEYQRAIKVLDQFERHIAQQDKPRADVIFSQTHQDARQKALQLLEQSATAGNTAAMLRLAMYQLLGETAHKTDNEAGIDLIKQAADAGDSRAQRLLSRLYYQGDYMPQDMMLGRNWLEQAARNGHTEAATVVSEWQRAEALMTTKKQEQHSIKRYQVLVGAIAIAALLLFIFV